ncbi:MAG: BamA/TamA family outer membrane protein [Saprospiraceae bacterium]|nr:BamA/TamA family outer membrane protein [Saprospiraceae bacterium]
MVDSISIVGNKKTKDEVILRELNLRAGDTLWINQLEKDLDQFSFNLMNTGLFASADILVEPLDSLDTQGILRIKIREMLYVYPVPILELGDRNFNVWWEEHNHRLDRLNYGLKLYHTNFTGQRDYLKLGAQFGYTNKFSASYRFPYLNKAQTLGINYDIAYKRNKEVQYNTVGNKQQFLNDDEKFLLQRFATYLELTYRPAYRTFHNFRLGYDQNRVDEAVWGELNPDFFGNGRSMQQFFKLSYFLVFENRNIQPYPTEGQRFEFEIDKQGLGIFDDLSTLWLTANFFQYYPISKNWSTEHVLRARTEVTRNKQPYFNSQALGFGSSFVRGYEFYVIDGLDFFLSRNSLRWQLLNGTFDWGAWLPIKSLRYMPTKFFLTFNGDIGYVNNPFYGENNQLSNKVVSSFGMGLNLIVFYNKVFKLEYSFNAEGEHGWFIHTQLGI